MQVKLIQILKYLLINYYNYIMPPKIKLNILFPGYPSGTDGYAAGLVVCIAPGN